MDLQHLFKVWRVIVTFYLTCMGVKILSSEPLSATYSKLSTKVQYRFLWYIIIDTIQSVTMSSSINKLSLAHHVLTGIGICIWLYYKCSPPLIVACSCLIECITVSRVLLFANVDPRTFLYIRKYLTLGIRLPALLISSVSIPYFWNQLPNPCLVVVIGMLLFLFCFDVYCLDQYNQKLRKMTTVD